MKLEETENLKLQYLNNMQANTSQIYKFQMSETELAEKITQMINIFEKTQNLKANHHSKNGVAIALDILI